MAIARRRDRWVIDFYDGSGRRQRLTMPEGATKTKARERLREIEESLSKGSYLPCKKVPLFSEVSQEWLEHKRPQVRATTWENYEGHVRNHFKDFNGLKVTAITTATVERFTGQRQKNEMNIDTLRRVLVTLNQIFSYAVRHRYIPHNPLRDAERPRDPKKEKRDMVILNPEQIQALLEQESDFKYRTLFLVASMSGARQGEILGLKWGDVDWDAGQIHVQRTFTKGRFFPTKTLSSNRHIDLGPLVLRELRKWKLACPHSKLDLIFPNGNGSPIEYGNMVKRYYHPALESAGLPRVTFHSLRHTYASLLIAQGENVKYIQNQLGHSTPVVTLSVYSHLMEDRNEESARRLEETVFSNRSQFGHNTGEETK